MNTLSIYLLTWNVCATEPSTPNIIKSLFDGQADLVAIGLQEVKSQPQNLLSDSLYEDTWTNTFRDILAKHDYVKIHTVRVLGILMSVFSKKRHLSSIRNIEASYVRTGLAGYWGNKGAVMIRFSFNSNSICIVNSHLPAHDHALLQRITDYNTIVNSQAFYKEKINRILDHDYVFWIGDLNFRLETGSFATDEIVDYVREKKLMPLLEKDELTSCIENHTAFDGFTECKIDFAPTYKFRPGSEDYDKKRRPAWTDRILFKAYNQRTKPHRQDSDERRGEILCLNYTSHPKQILSDHKPVTANLSVKITKGDLDTVTFDPIASWKSGEDGKITYTLPSSLQHNSYQWIAIFRENFSSLGEYLTYVWSPEKPTVLGKARTYEINIPSNLVNIPGKYVVAYMSEARPYHVMGISPVFKVERA